MLRIVTGYTRLGFPTLKNLVVIPRKWTNTPSRLANVLTCSLEDRSKASQETDDISKLSRWAQHEAELCDSGNPDFEFCELPEITSSQLPFKELQVTEEAWSRGRWLLGLLVLQSSSSFILDSYQQLLKDHLVVTLFLTMLVGAGGNAGNQSAIKVIRGLATGTFDTSAPCIVRALKQQAGVGLLLGSGLAAGGWVRVWLTNGDQLNSTAIACSLFLIVVTSVLAGTLLPFGLSRLGVDPANAGTSIQVLMDVGGVVITCICCHFILDIFAQSLMVI